MVSGLFRQRFSKAGKNALGAVEQDYRCGRRINPPKVPAQSRGPQLRERCRQFQPVGPAPTKTNVICRWRSSASSVDSANSYALKIFDRIVSASVIVFKLGAYSANSSWPK